MTDLFQPYRDAAARGELAIQRCRACRRWIHFPEASCPACGSDELAFEAVDLKWSDTESGNVVATVNVTTANKPPGRFSFPMEFTPVHDRWELTRKTADLLLDFGAAQTTDTSQTPPP